MRNSLPIRQTQTMKRPSKKEIRAALEKLRNPADAPPPAEEKAAPLPEKKTSMRIRKKGI